MMSDLMEVDEGWLFDYFADLIADFGWFGFKSSAPL